MLEKRGDSLGHAGEVGRVAAIDVEPREPTNPETKVPGAIHSAPDARDGPRESGRALMEQCAAYHFM